MTPDEALATLKKGNAEFVTDAPFRAAEDRKRRLEIARAQHPFAILVGCSDSRVPPELLFGRGLGELFIIRVAGNTVDQAGLGSIEFGVAEFGVPLVVVLGHERCGAVKAAVEVVEHNATFPGAIDAIVSPIIPAVLKAKGEPGDLVDNAVRENVRQVVARLRTTGPILSEASRPGGFGSWAHATTWRMAASTSSTKPSSPQPRAVSLPRVPAAATDPCRPVGRKYPRSPNAAPPRTRPWRDGHGTPGSRPEAASEPRASSLRSSFHVRASKRNWSWIGTGSPARSTRAMA